MPKHLSKFELEKGLDIVQQSPMKIGTLELIVVRPKEDEREVLKAARLDEKYGVEGDCWIDKPSSSTPNNEANPEKQVTIMNARAIQLIAQEKERWPLAGDQLYMDLDLSKENLHPGNRLAIGMAILEITASPHTGCSKFTERFGIDATKFVNSYQGKHLRLRGINAKVIRGGMIRPGDKVIKHQHDEE